MSSPDPGCDLQNFRQRGAGFQCDLAGPLDDRPVGHRVGKGNTEFDHVRTGIDQTIDENFTLLRSGTADGGVNDERAALFRAATVQAKVDA